MHHILLIDVQEGFCKNHECSQVIADHLMRLDNICVYATHYTNPPDSLWRKNMDWHEMSEGDKDTKIASNITSFIERVYEKPSYLLPQDLIEDYKKNAVHKVYLGGADIEACVMAAAFSLFDNGIQPIIVKDWIWSSENEKFYKAGIMAMERSFGAQNVINFSQLIK